MYNIYICINIKNFLCIFLEINKTKIKKNYFKVTRLCVLENKII